MTLTSLTPEQIAFIKAQGLNPDDYALDASYAPQQEVAPTSSALGAGGRAALASAVPTFAGGAAAGATAGLLGGPAAPVTSTIGAIIGAMAGGYAAGKAQEAIMPEVWKAKLAQDAAEHPVATTVGGLAAMPVGGMSLNPRTAGKALATIPELIGGRATFAGKQALMNASIGSALGGAQEAVMQKLQGQDLDAGAIARQAAVGFAFNDPNKLGQKLFGFHANTQRALDNPDVLAGRIPTVKVPEVEGQKVTSDGGAAKDKAAVQPRFPVPDYLQRIRDLNPHLDPNQGINTPKVDTVPDALKESLASNPPKTRTELEQRVEQWFKDNEKATKAYALDPKTGKRVPTEFTKTMIDELAGVNRVEVTENPELGKNRGSAVPGEAKVATNPAEATNETIAHELEHARETFNKLTPEQKSLVRTEAETKAGKELTYDQVEEHFVQQSALKLLEQRLNINNEKAIKKWFNDLRSNFKTRWNTKGTDVQDVYRSSAFQLAEGNNPMPKGQAAVKGTTPKFQGEEDEYHRPEGTEQAYWDMWKEYEAKQKAAGVPYEKTKALFDEMQRVVEAAPVPEKFMSEGLEQTEPKHIIDPEAVRRKNVEPDGRIWFNGERVKPTKEIVDSIIKSPLFQEASPQALAKRIETLEALKKQYPTADVSQVRNLGYKAKAIEADSSLTSWDEAIQWHKDRIAHTEQYVKDIRNAIPAPVVEPVRGTTPNFSQETNPYKGQPYSRMQLWRRNKLRELLNGPLPHVGTPGVHVRGGKAVGGKSEHSQNLGENLAHMYVHTPVAERTKLEWHPTMNVPLQSLVRWKLRRQAALMKWTKDIPLDKVKDIISEVKTDLLTNGIDSDGLERSILRRTKNVLDRYIKEQKNPTTGRAVSLDTPIGDEGSTLGDTIASKEVTGKPAELPQEEPVAKEPAPVELPTTELETKTKTEAPKEDVVSDVLLDKDTALSTVESIVGRDSETFEHISELTDDTELSIDEIKALLEKYGETPSERRKYQGEGLQQSEPELFTHQAIQLLRKEFPRNDKLDGVQVVNRLNNKLGDKSAEWQMWKDLGLQEYLRTPGFKSFGEIEQWMKENGPKVEVKTFGEGTISPIRKEYNRMTHEWYDVNRTSQSIIQERIDGRSWEEIQAEYNQPGINQEAKIVKNLYDKAYQEQVDKYAELTKLYLNEPFPESTQWSRISPKENMEGYTELAVHLPVKDVTDEKGDNPSYLFEGQHQPFPPNTLAHVRMYYETLPSGEKVAHIIEVQSDWGQYIRSEMQGLKEVQGVGSKDIQEYNKQKLQEVDKQNHPLLRDYNRLALKAAVEEARKNGATKIAISDAETAMLTEGHDQAATHTGTQIDKIIKEKGYPIYGSEAAARTEARSQGLTADDVYEFQDKGFTVIRPEILKEIYSTVPKEVSQEPGMRLNYDTILPKIAEELTGSKGEKVSFGEHKNAIKQGQESNQDLGRVQDLVEANQRGEITDAQLDTELRNISNNRQRENLIFRNADGTPKTDASARVYDISSIAQRRQTGEPFTTFGKKYQQEGLAATEPELQKRLAESTVKQLVYHSTPAKYERADPDIARTQRDTASIFGMHFGTKEHSNNRFENRMSEDETWATSPYHIILKKTLRVPDYAANMPHQMETFLSQRRMLLPEDKAALNKISISADDQIKRADILLSVLKRHGYDGLVYANEAEGKGDSYVVFDKKNIINALAPKREAGTGELYQGSGLNQSEPILQIDTPEFKRWFGKSKVVDKDGRPLRVYHGTYYPFFTIFETNPKTVFSKPEGDYSPQMGMHAGTAEQSNKHANAEINRGNPAIYPLYLKIENPLRLPDHATWEVSTPELPNYLDRGILKNIPDSVLSSKEKQQILNTRKSDRTQELYLQRLLLEKGYDGIVYSNAVEGIGDSYIAFNPEQIKSAIGNRGTFDPNNPDIRFQKQGLPKTEPIDVGEKDMTKQAFYEPMASTFDKVKRISTPVAQAFVNFSKQQRRFLGERNAVLKDLSKFSNEEIADAVTQLRANYRDLDKKPLNEAAKLLQQYFTKTRDFQIEQGLTIGGREAGKNEFYVPDMLNDKTIDILVNKSQSPEAKAIENAWVEHAIKEAKDRADVVSTINEKEIKENIAHFINALGGKHGNYKAVEFGAIRKASGYGLPEGLRETDGARIVEKYGRRYAADLSLYMHLEKPKAIAGSLMLRDPNTGRISQEGDAGISRATEVRDAMKWVTGGFAGTISTSMPKINSFVRLVNNSLLGPATGIRDTVSIPANMLPYINKFSDLKAAWDGMMKFRENQRRALESGATQPNMDRKQFGDLMQSPDRFTAVVGKLATLMRKYQGRELLENFNRDLTFSIGRELASHNVIGAKGGNEKSVQWLKKFGDLVEGDVTKLEGAELNKALDTIAANFTDRNQGTYGGEGLPVGVVESQFAPFLSMQKWSWEKSNVIYKDVVKPFLSGENRLPMLTYVFGSFMTGVAIQQLNELMSGKKPNDPTLKETIEYGGALNYAAELATLMQMGSFAGLVGDAMKLTSDKLITGKTPRNIVSFPAATLSADLVEKTGDMLEALRQGEDAWPVFKQYAMDTMVANVQAARMVANHTIKAGDIERSDKFRDMRVFNQLEGKPASNIPQVNRYLGIGSKQFKQERDLEKAVGQSRELVRKALSSGNVEQMRRTLKGLKGNNYSTVPDPTTRPQEFQRYYQFIVRTQGQQAANELLRDYFTMKAVNRAKSQLIPSI